MYCTMHCSCCGHHLVSPTGSARTAVSMLVLQLLSLFALSYHRHPPRFVGIGLHNSWQVLLAVTIAVTITDFGCHCLGSSSSLGIGIPHPISPLSNHYLCTPLPSFGAIGGTLQTMDH